MKQPKIITQQPNKIKLYTESKTADLTLQSGLIIRHVLPKNVHKVVRLKL